MWFRFGKRKSNLIFACVGLAVGAIVGAGVVSAIAPEATTTSEYVELKARMDRTADSTSAKITDQSKQIRELQEGAEAVKAQEIAAKEKEAELDARDAALDTAEQVVADSKFSDGIHLVGTNVTAGSYSLADSSDCYYAWKTSTGADAEIIDNNIVNGPATVTLVDGDIFETRGCGEWSKAS
jgi:gas vesicle protein